MTSTWYNNNTINSEHTNLPVKQIYVWFTTKDDKIAIVGNGKGKFQLPGGKPEQDESRIETMRRELFEEAGIKLVDFKQEPEMFGYYLLQNDPNWPNIPKYLQLRYYIFVDRVSDEIELSVNERIDDKDQMQECRFVDLCSISDFIPWTKGLEEYERLKNIKMAV